MSVRFTNIWNKIPQREKFSNDKDIVPKYAELAKVSVNFHLKNVRGEKDDNLSRYKKYQVKFLFNYN